MLGQMNETCRSTVARLALLAALTTVACGEEDGAPNAVSLVGTWDWIGFTDSGLAATVTGTMVFRTDGTYTVDGTITFPEEPTDELVASGTYVQSGDNVAIRSNRRRGTGRPARAATKSRSP